MKTNTKVVIDIIDKLIGKTPMINVDGILAKLETTNPTGNVKDRAVRIFD